MDRRGWVLLALWWLVRSSQVEAAEPPVALWGVYRCAPDSSGSCERIAETEPDVEKLVRQLGAPQWSIGASGVAGLPACTPPQCGEQVKNACGTGAGRVLGVFVQQQNPVTQVRAWLYDIPTQRLAVRDNYCNDCDITTAVKDNVKTLLQAPTFGGYADATPSYCKATESLRSVTGGRPRGRVAIIVVNDGKKSSKYGAKDWTAELKAYLRQGDRETIGITQVPAKPTLDTLRKLLDGDKSNQVLIIEGTDRISLFDGTTEKTSDAKEVSCDGCEYKQYLERLKSATGMLLEHCFGSECAGVTAQSKPPAPEACRPFTEPTPLSAASPASTPAGPGNRVEPQLARLTKGVLWGLFAAGTATTIGLAVANNFVRENRDVSGTDSAGNSFSAQGVPFDNVYGKAALTATGFTVAILGVAIPITIGIVRSERGAEPSPRARPAPSQGIQCFK